MTIEGDQAPQGSEPDNEPQGSPEAAPQGDGQESHDSTDWKAQSRKWEAQAKKDREARKALEDRLKQAITPEQVATTSEALAAAQTDAEALRMENTRLKVALSEGLPADLAVRLLGGTEDEIREDANRLKALLKPATPAADAKKGQASTPPAGKPDPNELLRQIIASR